MDNEHMLLIKKHYSFLVNNLVVKSTGLLAQLYTSSVIDQRDMEYLDNESISHRRNQKLLAMLGRKSKEHFDHFLKALSETDQSFIADALHGKEECSGMMNT